MEITLFKLWRKRVQTLHFTFHNIPKLSEGEQRTAHQVWLASMGHVFKTKLDVENFQWLTSLNKVHKETLHKVGAGTDGPHAQIKF